jgi:hypothetical protein
MSLLPNGYQSLEPFVADWAIPTLAGRAERRNRCTPEERQMFYEAVRSIAVQALAELDTKPLDQLDEAERHLMALLLSYAQAAMSIEVRLDGEAAHARDREHMKITHEPAGFPQ